MRQRIRNILLETAESSNINDAFWEWFADSKIVDPDGSPRVVYHKTGKRFRSFSLKKATQNIIWLTTNKEALESGEIYTQGSGIIMELYASVTHPAGWDEYHKLMLDQIEQQYDGVILKSKGDNYEIIVFDPKKIKSIHNKGTWDPNSSEIMK